MSRNFRLFAFTATVAWVVGVMNEASIMYVVAGVAASVILIAFALSRLAAARLRAQLSVGSARCRAGAGLSATVRVRSVGSIALPSAGVELTAQNLTVPEVVVRRRVVLPPLPPGAELEAPVELTCPARGRYRVGPVVLYDSDPIGMFEYRCPQGEALEVVALPRTVDLPRLSTWEAQPGGVRAAPVPVRRDHGEFHGIRQHTPGDDLRHVHWKVTAHTGELVVKQYETAYHDVISLHLDLGADNHRGQGAQSTLETAISAAASVARAALAEQRLVAVHGEGLSPALAAPESGQAQLQRIMLALAEVQAKSRRSFTEVLRGQLAQVRRGASVFIVTTPAEEALVVPLGRAVVRGLPVRVLLVNHPEFSLTGEQPLRRLLGRLRSAGVGVGLLQSAADLPAALVAALPGAGRSLSGVV